MTRFPFPKKYERIAYHLQLVGFEDAELRRQLIQTTDEHPFGTVERDWTKSQDLELGESVRGPAEIASGVTSNTRKSYPEGVKVYNMEIEGTHTYFVRAEGSDAEPVWVHNAADYEVNIRSDAVRRAVREIGDGATEVHVNTNDEAMEVLLRKFIGGNGDAYKNTTGWSIEQSKNWGKAGTYHWDTEFRSTPSKVFEDAYPLAGHYDDFEPGHSLHNYWPHLQIHTTQGETIRILVGMKPPGLP